MREEVGAGKCSSAGELSLDRSAYACSSTVTASVVDCDLNLSEAGDLTEAAARLFDGLHRLNAMGAERIAVSPIPETGLGRAINDRLRRAAAPR